MVPSVSIVIPAYNEATRLRRTLGDVVSFLRAYGAVELLVVDDGSTDGTAELAERYLEGHGGLAWRVLRLTFNRGKGFAVRQGLLAARAPVALFSDADLSRPMGALRKLVDAIARGECDIAFGSRALDRRLIETPQPAYRDGAGRLFNLALRLTTGLPFLDTQCGLKAFRMSVCRSILAVGHRGAVWFRRGAPVRCFSRRPQDAEGAESLAAPRGQSGSVVTDPGCSPTSLRYGGR